jgi:two-component system phosphate regulon response regulator PhoB
MAKKRILIIEDDRDLSEILAYNLEQAGFAVSVVRDGREGLRLAHVTPPDLVVLDLMLPELDGIEVCRRLRSSAGTRNVLVLMLTAKSQELDQLIGYSVGADDYVTKPFSLNVLLQRIRALLRRHDGHADDRDVVVSQGIVVDRPRHRATAGDRPMPLTKSEFSLLEVLMRNMGRAFSRSELIDAALGGDAIVLERTIDVHIRALRKKLGPFAHLIETIRGIGYRFHDPQNDAPRP